MAFHTPKQRRDEYLYSCWRVGADLPSDEEIYAVTGYSSWRMRLRFGLIVMAGMVAVGLAVSLIALLIK